MCRDVELAAKKTGHSAGAGRVAALGVDRELEVPARSRHSWACDLWEASGRLSGTRMIP